LALALLVDDLVAAGKPPATIHRFYHLEKSRKDRSI
jgi:hypothetical protein